MTEIDDVCDKSKSSRPKKRPRPGPRRSGCVGVGTDVGAVADQVTTPLNFFVHRHRRDEDARRRFHDTSYFLKL